MDLSTINSSMNNVNEGLDTLKNEITNRLGYAPIEEREFLLKLLNNVQLVAEMNDRGQENLLANCPDESYEITRRNVARKEQIQGVANQYHIESDNSRAFR